MLLQLATGSPALIDLDMSIIRWALPKGFEDAVDTKNFAVLSNKQPVEGIVSRCNCHCQAYSHHGVGKEDKLFAGLIRASSMYV